MRDKFLYLSLIPESFVASMLDPEAFGRYMAVGKKARSRGPAIFFEIDPGFQSEAFPMDLVETRCVPHEDGTPRHSVYLSIYRVLEQIPVSALGKLYLATDDGRVLALERGEYRPETGRAMHLYQEFGPVDPCVASSLDALEFCKLITTPGQPVSVPRIVFSELILRELAHDPEHGNLEDLPYQNIEHLRGCLTVLKKNPGKKNKMVRRQMGSSVLFRTIRNGFFVGSQDEFAHYPMPSKEVLDEKHHDWLRSAEIGHAG